MHLTLFYQRIASLIKLKELLSLLATTDVDLSIQCALQYSAEVTKGMLHILNVDHS